MAYCSEPCGSYFVETHDDLGQVHGHGLEGQKMSHRQKQEDIARDLSQLVSEEYRDDIVKHMAKMEVKSLTLSEFYTLLMD